MNPPPSAENSSSRSWFPQEGRAPTRQSALKGHGLEQLADESSAPVGGPTRDRAARADQFEAARFRSVDKHGAERRNTAQALSRMASLGSPPTNLLQGLGRDALTRAVCMAEALLQRLLDQRGAARRPRGVSAATSRTRSSAHFTVSQSSCDELQPYRRRHNPQLPTRIAGARGWRDDRALGVRDRTVLKSLIHSSRSNLGEVERPWGSPWIAEIRSGERWHCRAAVDLLRHRRGRCCVLATSVARPAGRGRRVRMLWECTMSARTSSLVTVQDRGSRREDQTSSRWRNHGLPVSCLVDPASHTAPGMASEVSVNSKEWRPYFAGEC